MPPRDPERRRLAEADVVPWRRWGPYLAERAWGTVREDYSAAGDAWGYLPHDHARSRAYRWSEDGLAGICDDNQVLCLALALWNGRDPILKERIFGLSGPEGNHGEDAKECWWFCDATPTASYLRWRYVYPQAAFPYEDLVDENRRRTRLDPEYDLEDSGVLDGDRYWDITVEYAKAAPEDICALVTVRNAGGEQAELEVLPTLWFRNTWVWRNDPRVPRLRGEAGRILAEHHRLGAWILAGDPAAPALVCDNETNSRRLFGDPDGPLHPKDGINDHVVGGAATVNPAMTGTRAALRHRVSLGPGESAELRLRLCHARETPDLGAGHAATVAARRREADEFHASLVPDGATADEAAVLRQALAGMVWSQQFYNYGVARWLDGDPAFPPPPPGRDRRNGGWRHLGCHEVISMPDTWEYPWFAAWDLAFHCVALAHIDSERAKEQLILLCREWYMHPNGQLPAYEWSFGDVNPPVHAWAALRVFDIDGGRDHAFLERVFHKLLINFTWWVNRKDAGGNNIFEGGFLGLDNIGPFDRSMLPAGAGHLEQSDATAWMAMYCLNLLELALTLARRDRAYEDVATKFFEHFTLIALAMEDQGLWDEDDGFYYDVLRAADGARVPLRAHSAVGLIPLLAVTVIEGEVDDELPDFASRMSWFLRNRPRPASVVSHIAVPGHGERRLLSIVSPERLRRMLALMLDEAEFLSPHGVRALSRRHLAHPLEVATGGATFTLDYEPGESTSALFGGNSNWRGPVWMPVNHLIIGALQRFHAYLGDGFRVEHPTGSGRMLTLGDVAADLTGRLVGLFTRGADGRRPCFGAGSRHQTHPDWRDSLLFHEYFHGDTGAGLGAAHQTGWTGLVADLIRGRGRCWSPPGTRP
jgi:hypothetical protein